MVCYMLIRSKDDWKQFLSQEDEENLNDVIRRVQKHRHAYRSSKELKLAQLWTAILELYKDNAKLRKKLERMNYIFDGMTDRVKKLQKEDEELLKSLEKF